MMDMKKLHGQNAEIVFSTTKTSWNREKFVNNKKQMTQHHLSKDPSTQHHQDSSTQSLQFGFKFQVQSIHVLNSKVSHE
jgi:hypothetical protein